MAQVRLRTHIVPRLAELVDLHPSGMERNRPKLKGRSRNFAPGFRSAHMPREPISRRIARTTTEAPLLAGPQDRQLQQFHIPTESALAIPMLPAPAHFGDHGRRWFQTSPSKSSDEFSASWQFCSLHAGARSSRERISRFEAARGRCQGAQAICLRGGGTGIPYGGAIAAPSAPVWYLAAETAPSVDVSPRAPCSTLSPLLISYGREGPAVG